MVGSCFNNIIDERTRTWSRALDDLGKKVCALYPFICELCFEVGHFDFQCSGHNDSISNLMNTSSFYCDDRITPNQHDELTLFLGCEELSGKTSLLDMSALDMNGALHGCHLYCVDNCHANTYIQNSIKDGTLPKYDRANMCFTLINEREKSTQVSSIVSKNKPGYVEKLPFKPLPPKEGKKKKNKNKKSKKREEKVISHRYVSPIMAVAYDSEFLHRRQEHQRCAGQDPSGRQRSGDRAKHRERAPPHRPRGLLNPRRDLE